MDSGVATRPIADFDAYRERLHAVRLSLRPADEADLRGGEEGRRSASSTPKARTSACCARCRSSSTKGSRKPILVGRPAVIEQRIERFGLRIKPGADFEIVNPENDPRYRDYWTEYYRLTAAQGRVAAVRARSRCAGGMTLIGAMMIHMGDADGMLCGTFGTHDMHRALHRPGDRAAPRRAKTYAAMNAVMLPTRTVFIADTYVNVDPDAGADRRDHAARRRGDPPLRHHAEGRAAVALELRQRAAHPQAKKMQARAGADQRAWTPTSRSTARCTATPRCPRRCALRALPDSRLKGEANLLIMPTRRRGQHLVQPAQDRRRQRRDARPDPARRRQARAHPHAVGDGAAHRQHDRADGRRRGVERQRALL